MRCCRIRSKRHLAVKWILIINALRYDVEDEGGNEVSIFELLAYHLELS